MRPLLERGMDPRKVFTRHKERGAKKFCYTYADLGELYGIKVDRVRWLVCQRKFNPRNLQDVIRFYLERAQKRGRPAKLPAPPALGVKESVG